MEIVVSLCIFLQENAAGKSWSGYGAGIYRKFGGAETTRILPGVYQSKVIPDND